MVQRKMAGDGGQPAVQLDWTLGACTQGRYQSERSGPGGPTPHYTGQGHIQALRMSRQSGTTDQKLLAIVPQITLSSSQMSVSPPVETEAQ